MISQTTRLAAVLAVLATPSLADMTVEFREGAPKDRFVFRTDTGVCQDGPFRITLDLAGSAAGLIFDVTGQGAGVEVYQPVELVEGAEIVAAMSRVEDGDAVIVLDLLALDAGQSVAFTVDVDDTLGGREITVSDSEIVGANVTLAAGGQTWSGTFSDRSIAQVDLPDCQA